MNKRRVRDIIKKLQPYVNGKLITHVFVNYWDELVVELFKNDNKSCSNCDHKHLSRSSTPCIFCKEIIYKCWEEKK